MEIETSYPGLQFYTGHHLAAPLRRFGGACLEPQYFPDAANQPSFAPTLLETGQRYVETVLYRFVGKP
jgi:aldose 1-epimerase